MVNKIITDGHRWPPSKGECAPLGNPTKLDELFSKWQSDPTAYETPFFTEVKDAVDKLARGRIADWDDAAQVALMKAWQTISSFDPARGGLAEWLRVIVRSAVIDQLRKTSRESEIITTDLGVKVGDDGEVKAVTIDDIVATSATSSPGWPTWNTWTRAGLLPLFDHDGELVEALLQSSNLAHVERLTGRTRKAVRHAVKMAQRRYAEIYEKTTVAA
jgi:DNA-directed RNA polymerase specialized sigma24 family protein